MSKKSSSKNNKASDLLHYYEQMLLIRRFEEKAGQLYGMGLIAGFCHLYIGQEAIAVAVYSMIPPIRLDWNDVEVRLCCGGEKARLNIKGEEGKNIVYVSTSWAVAFWGEFKNSASFVGELPLRQELPKDLFHVFRKTYPAEKIDAKDYCWFPLKIPNFGTYLARLAKLITGKNFTNRLMRSSYITWYHKNNNQDAFDLEKTRAVMRLLHQTNLEVHLAYNKFKSIDDLPEEIMNHITNVGNAESDSD